jgi:hypothetical protein
MVETHLEKRLIGYARVSTYGQTLDSQLEQLRAAGCSSRNIYREKVTGVRADRRELNRMLGKLAPGDVVTVTRIDRLARSTFDLFAIVRRIVDAKAQFRSLAEPFLDTTRPILPKLFLPSSALPRSWSIGASRSARHEAGPTRKLRASNSDASRPSLRISSARRESGRQQARHSAAWRAVTMSVKRQFRGLRYDRIGPRRQ